MTWKLEAEITRHRIIPYSLRLQLTFKHFIMSSPLAKRRRLDSGNAMPTHDLSIADIVCKLSRRELRRLLLAESERNRHVLRAVTDYFETTRGISTDLDFKHHVSFVYHYFKPLRTSSYYMKEKPMISKLAMKPAPPDKIKPVLQTICQEVTDIASLGTVTRVGCME